MAGSLTNIRHIVVLMLENRSFDNLLGWQYGLQASDANTYSPASGPPIKVPSWSDSGTSPGTMTIPNPDPGESFEQMNQQIFGLRQTPPPGTLPTGPGPLGPMGGFAQNYLEVLGGNASSVTNIMHAFTSSQVSALSALASAFTAVQTYHASAPCQTLPNRCFAQLGTANGFVNNETMLPNGTSIINAPYFGPTIFNQISNTPGLDWRIYFGDFPLTLAMADVWRFIFTHFRWFADFASDVERGDLPAYTWIEPSYQILPDDMHPPHDVLLGDLLVAQVYNALRKSPLWDSTLLIITFDEHGGCYDRMFPGSATSPGGPYADGFTFDRYGVRVPTVLCSPFIPEGAPDPSQSTYDHTSILRTVRNAFGVQGGVLSAREGAAQDLSAFLTLSPSNMNLGPLSVAPAASGTQSSASKLNSIQRVVVKLAGLIPERIEAHAAALSRGAGAMDRSTTVMPSAEEGSAIVREKALRLFPPRRH